MGEFDFAPEPQHEIRFDAPVYGPQEEPPVFGTPGKSVRTPALSLELAAVAQDLRISRAAVGKLQGPILSGLMELRYQGKTNSFAELEAHGAMKKIEATVALADQKLPRLTGFHTPEARLQPLYTDLSFVRDQYRQIKPRIVSELAGIAEARRERAAKAKAPPATHGPKPPPRATAPNFSKHAALPDRFDLGKVDPGQRATESFAIWNLVARPCGISVEYQGDPSLRLVGKPHALRPAGEQMSERDRNIALEFAAPRTKGTYQGWVTVTYTWSGEQPAPERYVIPIVAHALAAHEKTDAEREADRTAHDARQKQEAKDKADKAAGQKLVDDFNKKHPSFTTNRFEKEAARLAIEIDRLTDKQKAGITLAKDQIVKYHRKIPPKENALWMDLAMLALDVAGASIAGRIAKSLEGALAGMTRMQRTDWSQIPGMGIEIRHDPVNLTRSVIAMYTDATKEAIKGGARVGRKYAGDGQPGEDRDDTRDAAALFFTEQATALADTKAERKTEVLNTKDLLRPLLYVNEDAAVECLHQQVVLLKAEADGVKPAHDQAHESVVAWVRFLQAQGGPGALEVNRVGGANNYDPVAKRDGLIDIGFQIGNKPTDPVQVKSARLLGVSDTVAARFQSIPLLGEQVTVRAYGLPSPNHAEVLLTVIRYAGGSIAHVDQTGLHGHDGHYLARKARQKGGDDRGARILIEEEILSRSLQQHGVVLEHDHDRTRK